MGNEMRYFRIEMFDGTVSCIRRKRQSECWGDEELCDVVKVTHELFCGKDTIKEVCVCTEEEWKLGKELNN
jgi:hypothetical protein